MARHSVSPSVRPRGSGDPEPQARPRGLDSRLRGNERGGHSASPSVRPRGSGDPEPRARPRGLDSRLRGNERGAATWLHRPLPRHPFIPDRSIVMNDVKAARTRGRRFKAARVARGLTQRELGRRVGATQSVITQIERGVIADSKFDALINYELGLPVDAETVRFILAARQAK